jgi:hypothetical protein
MSAATTIARTPRAPSPQKLDSGENLRRARIGIVGKFFGDWNYALIYDFGGSSDGFGGAAPGSLPGGGTSGVENAYLSYTGFEPFGGKMAIEGGIMDIPWTLDEATSSNDILFMERASVGIIAQNIAAGDFRSGAGTRWWNDQLWIGGYVTGPTSGAIHSASSVTPAGSSEQYGGVIRIAGNPISGKNYSVHIGADAEWLVQPPRNLVTQAQTLTLSDRPELRIDPTTLISTGAIANVSGAQVYGAEGRRDLWSVHRAGRILLVQCRPHREHGTAAIRRAESEVRRRLRAGRLRADRREPRLQPGDGLLRRDQAARSVLARRRQHRRVGNRRSRQHDEPQRPGRPGGRRRRRTADRLHRRAELVRQQQRPLHAELPAWRRRQAGLGDLERGRRVEVRRGRAAHAGCVLRQPEQPSGTTAGSDTAPGRYVPPKYRKTTPCKAAGVRHGNLTRRANQG